MTWKMFLGRWDTNNFEERCVKQYEKCFFLVCYTVTCIFCHKSIEHSIDNVKWNSGFCLWNKNCYEPQIWRNIFSSSVDKKCLHCEKTSFPRLGDFKNVAVISPKFKYTENVSFRSIYVGGCKTLSYSNILNTLSNNTLISSWRFSETDSIKFWYTYFWCFHRMMYVLSFC